MNAEISAAWDKVQSIINGFIALLPNTEGATKQAQKLCM
jgi:hypothetical protein